MKKIIFCLWVVCASFSLNFISPPAADASEKRGSSYIGSTHSNKYHRLGCAQIGKIKAQDFVIFGSEASARKHGYVPCPICRPDKKEARANATHLNQPETAQTAIPNKSKTA